MMKQTPQASGKAVIYARYSSHQQKDVSIEQQVDECTEYAVRSGYSILHVYADRHISGKTERRPEFQRMVRDAEKHTFDAVISYKSNRISRKMLHALSYEEKLERMGVHVLYAKEEFGNNAAGRFALRMMMNMNQFYSENMGEDIKRGMMDNAKQCKVNSGAIPFGYRKGEDGRFAIDESKVEILKEIFGRVARGDSYTEISNDLNNRRIKTAYGNKWNKSSFHSMMKNERYLGIYIFDDVRIEGGMPTIISKELFDKVQNQMKSRKESNKSNRWQKSDFLLTGKLYCGHCMSSMFGYSGTSKTGTIHYYYVCKKRQIDKACSKKNVRRDAAERLVANAIKDYILAPKAINWIADNAMTFAKRMTENSTLKETETELANVRKQIKNIMNAIEQGIITETTRERLIELEEEKKDIQERLEIEKRMIPTVTREQIIVWLESFRKPRTDDSAFRKELFNTFLEAAYLYDDRLRLVFNYTGKLNDAEFPLSDLMETDSLESIEGSSMVECAPPQSV